jgi:hypothetical protein
MSSSPPELLLMQMSQHFLQMMHLEEVFASLPKILLMLKKAHFHNLQLHTLASSICLSLVNYTLLRMLLFELEYQLAPVFCIFLFLTL